MPQHNLPMVENLVSVLRLVLPPANFTPAVPLDWSNLQFTNTSLKPIADCVKRPALRACFQTQRVSILPKFCATFWQNFAAVSGILQKILPKNEPKFMEKRGAVGFKTGSSCLNPSHTHHKCNAADNIQKIHSHICWFFCRKNNQSPH